MDSSMIDVPENLAHPGKRFQGQFIDGLVSYLVGYMALYLLSFAFDKDVAGPAAIIIGLSYFLFSDSLPNGQSIGKRLLGIQVLNGTTKQPCTIIQSFIRNITFPLGIIDWIFILFQSHRRLGDYLASTVVVKVN
jgi:uncharacterized RDD family membrane protein YckC